MLCYYCHTAITSANACVSYHLALLVEINNCSAHLSVRHKRQTVRNGISQNKNIDVTGRDTVHAASCMQDALYSYVWQIFICIYMYPVYDMSTWKNQQEATYKNGNLPNRTWTYVYACKYYTIYYWNLHVLRCKVGIFLKYGFYFQVFSLQLRNFYIMYYIYHIAIDWMKMHSVLTHRAPKYYVHLLGREIPSQRMSFSITRV